MKCKNIITGNIFEVQMEEAKKLLNDYDCFEIVTATEKERKFLQKTEVIPSTIRQRVMKSVKK